jgi:hypothetical protein
VTPDGLVDVVEFQIGVRSMAGQFTVNVGVSIPEVALATQSPAEGIVTAPSCAMRGRLGALAPAGADRWWPIREHPRVLDDVRLRLRDHAMPFFERFATRDAVLRDYSEDLRSHGHPVRIVKAIVLAGRGRGDEARALLEEQIAGTTVAGHGDYVRALAARLGLDVGGGPER